MTNDEISAEVEYLSETYQALAFACTLAHIEAKNCMTVWQDLEYAGDGEGEEAEAARADEKYCREKLLRLVHLRNKAEADGNALLLKRGA